MGIGTVQVALTYVHHLRAATDRTALLYMAARCLDTVNSEGQPPYLYYGGEDELLTVLYGPRDSYDTSSRRHLRETMQRLRKAGYVKRLGLAQRGTRQTWKLIFMTGDEAETFEDDRVPEQGTLSVPNRAPCDDRTGHPVGTKQGTPRKDLGRGQEKMGRTSSVVSQPTGTLASDAPVDNGQEEDVSAGDGGVEGQRQAAPASRPPSQRVKPTSRYDDKRLMKELESVVVADGRARSLLARLHEGPQDGQTRGEWLKAIKQTEEALRGLETKENGLRTSLGIEKRPA